MKTKLFTLFLALAASIGTIFAESGTCGENLTWDLTNGVLTISGTGAMDNFSSPEPSVWFDYKEQITQVIISNGVTSIGNYAFYQCTSLTSVFIPYSITSIGDDAFEECTSLTSINIPNSVTGIGDSAFEECTSLTAVTMGNGVTSIGYDAFYGCSSLTSVHISDIAAWCAIIFMDNPLKYARNLYFNGDLVTDLIIPNVVTSIGDKAFEGYTSVTSVTIPNSVTSIGDHAFEECTSLTAVTMGNGVTSIGYDAFFGCTSLTSINIPNSVTSLGEYAFWGCSSLTSAIIGSGVTRIEEATFAQCSALAYVAIGNSVTSIGESAFSGCTGLTSVTIPNSVTSIASYAFGCTGLTSITCYAINPPTCEYHWYTADGVFKGVPKNIPLYVFAESITAYKAAEQWKDFEAILPISTIPVETTTIIVNPQANSVDIAWPAVSGAATYELVIKDNSGNTICTLIFNAQGQLTSISFSAPARDNAEQKEQSAGFQFNVNGLESGTAYTYTITAKDANGDTLNIESGSFTTTSGKQAIENISTIHDKSTKILHNGQILILHGNKTYTIDGRLVEK